MKGKVILKALCLLLASGILLSCTGKAPANSNKETTTTQNKKEPAGAITPGKAEDHLVQNGNSYTLYSPNGQLAITVDVPEEGRMTYSVTRTRDGETLTWVRSSQMGVSVRTKHFFSSCTVEGTRAEHVKETYALMGNQRSVESNCMQATLSLAGAGYTSADGYSLEVRAYNDGVAFRYNIPQLKTKNNVPVEHTTYALRSDLDKCWYGVNNQDYESEISGYSPSKASDDIITAPLTAVVKNKGGYISIMEGALNSSYPGVNLKAEGKATYSTCFYTTPTMQEGPMTSGWRLINIADDLNGLVNNYNIYTVNEQPDELYKDADWIVPGRSAWSWCMSHSAPTPEQMKQ